MDKWNELKKIIEEMPDFVEVMKKYKEDEELKKFIDSYLNTDLEVLIFDAYKSYLLYKKERENEKFIWFRNYLRRMSCYGDKEYGNNGLFPP